MTTSGNRITSVGVPSAISCPEVEHEDPFGEAHHRFHDVLDPDHRDAELGSGAPDHVDRALQLGVVEPCHHLVEQHEARPAGELAGDLEEPPFVQVQTPDRLIAPFGESYELEHLVGAARRVDLTETLPAEQRTHRDVLADRHRLERAWRLQHHRHAGLSDAMRLPAGDVGAVEDDAPAGRRLHAADRLQQRRLAGPVRADEGDDLALVDRERDSGDCRESAEPLFDVGQFEDRHRPVSLRPGRMA